MNCKFQIKVYDFFFFLSCQRLVTISSWFTCSFFFLICFFFLYFTLGLVGFGLVNVFIRKHVLFNYPSTRHLHVFTTGCSFVRVAFCTFELGHVRCGIGKVAFSSENVTALTWHLVAKLLFATFWLKIPTKPPNDSFQPEMCSYFICMKWNETFT